MGLILAILATLLVLFMVAAMAVAEWADKDPGEILAMLWKRKLSGVVSTNSTQAMAASKSVRARTTSSRGKIRSSKALKKSQAARKPNSSKRKPR
jgi:hypothetical protein